MSDIHLSGFLFNASGAAVNGATVEAFAKNTVTETGGTVVTGGSTTTNSSGYYTMTVTSDNELDVRITSGNSVRWRRFDDRLQIEEVEVSTLNIREGATAQVYTIAPGAIAADRVLTLPASTGADTLASLGVAQTFSAAQAFTSTVTVGTDGSGTDVVFYSATAGDNLTWDASAKQLIITGTDGATSLNVADGNVTIADNLTVSGNLTVTGTTTSVDSTTINAATAFVFEGATADAHETTLGIVDPTADATINLPAMGAGTYYLPVLAAATTATITSTPAELNLLDTAAANSVVNSKAVIYGSSGEVAASSLTIGGTNVVSGSLITTLGTVSAGTWQGTTVAVDQGGTGATTLTDGGVLLGNGTGAMVAMAVLADSEMIVGDGTTDPVAESGATLRTSIGVGTTDSPQVTGIELGHATDSTITRGAAGLLEVEGVRLVTVSATQTLTNKTLTTPTIGSFANSAHDHADAAGGAAVVSAGAAVSGIVELATTAETTTGTDAARAVTPDGLAGSVVFGTRYVQMVIADFTADIAEGNGKFYLHIPAGLNGMDLVEVHAKVITVGSGSTVSVQVHNLTDGSDMLSTAVTIDDGELDSKDAAAAVAIDTGEDDVVTNDVIRIDVDGNGGDSTIAKGLIVTLGFRLP